MKTLLGYALYWFIFPKTISSQTVLIDSLGRWVLIWQIPWLKWLVSTCGSASNVWYAGSITLIFSGNSAYVSDTGGSTHLSYVNNGLATTIGSFLSDIVLPQGINYLELSFQWINFPERSTPMMC